MPIAFDCPSCGASLENVDFTQPTTKCIYCGKVATIPPHLRQDPQPNWMQFDESVSDVEFQQVVIDLRDYTRPKVQTTQRRGMGLGGCIGVLMILLTALIPVGVSLWVFVPEAQSVFNEVATQVFGIELALPNATRTPVRVPGISGARTATPTAAAATVKATHEILLAFGGEGVGNGKFQDGRWLAVDGRGGIHVADYTSNGRVQSFDAQGNYLITFNAPARSKSSPVRCLTADRRGIVYVCREGDLPAFNSESGDKTNSVLIAQNDYVDQAIVLPNGNLALMSMKAGEDDLFIITPQSRRVLGVDKIISTITENAQTNIDMAADGVGNLYLLSQRDKAVFRFTAEGKFIDRFGRDQPTGDGKRPGDFRGTVGAVAVDSTGRIYISDFDGIKVFTNEGDFVGVIDTDTAIGFIHDMAFNTKDELFITDGKKVYKLRVML
jgi:hypothetical protein